MKVLQYRLAGYSDWEDYVLEFNEASLDCFEIGRIYTYEYRVIEIKGETK